MASGNVSPGGSDPRKTGDAARRTGPLPGSQPAGAVPLSHLLADTVDLLTSDDDSSPWHMVLTADDRQRLVDSIRRRGPRATFDLATAADLVEAVLPEALAAMAAGPTSRRRLIERIAESLIEDPPSARRLQELHAALVSIAFGPPTASGEPAP